MKIEEVKKQVEDRLTERSLKERYRKAMRFMYPYTEVMISRISHSLETDIIDWLLRNGYKPDDENSFLEIVSAEFDYGNMGGIATSVDAILEENPLPVNARILLALLAKNKELRSEIRLLELHQRILRPAWLTRLVRGIVAVFKRKQHEDDDE